MNQTRLSSLIEAVMNVAIGFVVSVILTAVVLPAYGHAVTFSQNLQITASIARSYCIRRWFNARIKRAAARLAQEA